MQSRLVPLLLAQYLLLEIKPSQSILNNFLILYFSRTNELHMNSTHFKYGFECGKATINHSKSTLSHARGGSRACPRWMSLVVYFCIFSTTYYKEHVFPSKCMYDLIGKCDWLFKKKKVQGQICHNKVDIATNNIDSLPYWLNESIGLAIIICCYIQMINASF